MEGDSCGGSDSKWPEVRKMFGRNRLRENFMFEATSAFSNTVVE